VRPPAVWIGGPQGSGKSSIARSLSRRLDLQLYVIDHRMWSHVGRQGPAMAAFMELSLDERWVEPTPERMLDWFVETSRERFRLVLEDLAALPPSPTVVVEGPQLFPSFVAPHLTARDEALFLLPDEASQRARLEARGGMTQTSDPARARANAVARDLMIGRLIERQATELTLRTLVVDRPLAEMIERAATVLIPVFQRGPRDVDLTAIRRLENQAIYEQVSKYRASGEARAEDLDRAISFTCECGQSGCAEHVELPLDAFAQADRVNAHCASGLTPRSD